VLGLRELREELAAELVANLPRQYAVAVVTQGRTRRRRLLARDGRVRQDEDEGGEEGKDENGEELERRWRHSDSECHRFSCGVAMNSPKQPPGRWVEFYELG